MLHGVGSRMTLERERKLCEPLERCFVYDDFAFIVSLKQSLNPDYYSQHDHKIYVFVDEFFSRHPHPHYHHIRPNDRNFCPNVGNIRPNDRSNHKVNTGEEITVSYLPSSALLSRKERQVSS